jgi:LPS sulfotransferase NodH
MATIADIFRNPDLNIPLLQEIEKIPDPRTCYLIAITPRSGSTYLCDVLTQTKRLGRPQEWLGASSIPKRIDKNMPGRSPEEFLRNALRVTKSKNNVAGLKASWFQFNDFKQALGNQEALKKFKYIYLTRRDLAAQAVSLYKATKSGIFHSDSQTNEEDLKKLSALPYDFAAIKYWYDHIVVQEKGWQHYFYEQNIYPCCIYYEDIEEDLQTVLKRFAIYVSVQPNNVILSNQPSNLQKLRNEISHEWTQRFQTDLYLKSQ